MLEFTELQEDIAALPQADQMLVVNFVALLKQRYVDTQHTAQTSDTQTSDTQSLEAHPLNLENEPFVGMWKENLETQDSSAWVKAVRQEHWQS